VVFGRNLPRCPRPNARSLVPSALEVSGDDVSRATEIPGADERSQRRARGRDARPGVATTHALLSFRGRTALSEVAVFFHVGKDGSDSLRCPPVCVRRSVGTPNG
jgi:hypothetical protein